MVFTIGMTITAILALAAALPAAPMPVQAQVSQAQRAVVVAVVRARIISSARVTIGAVPAKGQPVARNGLIEFE